MKSIVLILVAIVGSLFCSETQAEQSTAQDVSITTDLLSSNGADFGETVMYGYAEAEVEIVNRSRSEVNVVRVAPRLSADKVIVFEPKRLQSTESLRVKVRIDVGRLVGRIARYFDVYAEGGTEPVGSFAVRGFSDWIISPKSTFADLGNIDLERGVDHGFTIEPRPGLSVKMLDVLEPDPRFDAVISADGQTLRLKSRVDAPLGMFDSYVVVSTNSSLQKKMSVHVRGQIVTRIVPASNPVDFGLLRIGEGGSERRLRLEQIDGKPIEIGAIRSEGAPVTAKLQGCIPVADSCKLLILKVPEQQKTGQIGGVVYLDLPQYKREFPIGFGMVVIGKDTQIRDLAADMKAASAVPAPLSTVLKSAVSATPPPRQMTLPEGKGPLLTWQASNEQSIYGYEVYRGGTDVGPFERVNERMVRRLDDSGEIGSIYRWRDDHAQRGKAYWYYIGVVFTDGRKEKFSSPQKVIAK
jgi:hypothetical protein